MCVVIIIRSDFFWTERLGGAQLYLNFHFARVVCKYLPISLLLLYRRKRVPIVSARVPAVYYITLHYYDCCYYTMFGTRV